MDQAKLLKEMFEALDGLFSKFAVEVGNWPMLALLRFGVRHDD